MRLAIITVVFVALLSVQVACSSPKDTWYTVEPDALDSLAVSPEDVSEGKRPPGGEVLVNCALREGEREESDERWQPPCDRLTVTSRHQLYLYRPYQEPLSVRLAQIATDDDYVYSVVSRRYEPLLREIADKDEISAMRVQVIHDRSLSRAVPFLIGAGGFFASLSGAVLVLR